MTTLSAKITIYIPYAMSLKDKRQVKRSLIDRVRNKFNTAIAEVDTQDLHQKLTLGAAVVSESHSHAEEMLNEVIRFIEGNTDAEVVSVEIV